MHREEIQSVRHDNITPTSNTSSMDPRVTAPRTDKNRATPAMSDLEQAWELALAEAHERARAAGRRDIADYLNLRRKNDLLRRTATDWLIQSFVTMAGDANRAGAGVAFEQHEHHRFARGTASMVGKRIVLRRGVRELTVESGWPRTPRDGFIRGGGLACANIRHFGRPRMNTELMLVPSSKGAPQWLVLKDDIRSQLTASDLRRHFSLLAQS